MATTTDTHGKVLAESLLQGLGAENMFDGYCVAVRWKEELAELREDMVGWHHIVCADGLHYDYEFAPPQSQSSMVEEF